MLSRHKNVRSSPSLKKKKKISGRRKPQHVRVVLDPDLHDNGDAEPPLPLPHQISESRGVHTTDLETDPQPVGVAGRRPRCPAAEDAASLHTTQHTQATHRNNNKAADCEWEPFNLGGAPPRS